MDQLGPGGIIFLLRNDNLSHIFNLNYTDIGFYYTLNKRLYLFTFYNFGNYSQRSELDQFIKKYNITKICYKKIKKYTNEYHNIINNFKERNIPNKYETIKDIFNSKYYSFNMFNKIMRLIDKNIIEDNSYNLLNSNLFEESNYISISGSNKDSESEVLSYILNDDYLKKMLISLIRKEPLSSIENIKDTLNNLNLDIVKGSVPVLKINKLIININELLKHIEYEHKPIKLINEDTSLYCLLLVNKNVKDIPMRLINGDKILVPMNEYNYSKFSKDELIEMLFMLDVYSNGTPKFDQIRTLITKELTKRL